MKKQYVMVSFGHGQREYCYFSDLFHCKVGDVVIVPVKNHYSNEAVVMSVHSDVPPMIVCGIVIKPISYIKDQGFECPCPVCRARPPVDDE